MTRSIDSRPTSDRIPVEARGVSVSAGFKNLLSSISFTARPGEVLALLGPSGAGKSTLFRALNGSVEPDGGQVLYGGADLYEAIALFRTRIGYVPQDDILHDALTPRDVLYFAGRLRLPRSVPDDDVRRRADEVLAAVDLAERATVRVRRLSGGQRKRVNIGVELMTSPPVLFLDEPTSGLDPALEEKMMTLFKKLAREGRTLLVTTHVTESLDLVDRVLVLCSGKLTFVGRPRAALGFFGVETFSDIYGKLAAKGADHWASAFPSSPFARESAANVPAAAPAHHAVTAASDTAEALLAQLEREMAPRRPK